MKPAIILACGLSIAALCLAAAPATPLAGTPWGSSESPAGQVYVYNYDNVLGTSLQLKILASSEAQAKQAAAAALAEIDREDKLLSSWDRDSEFSHWFRTRNEPIRVSPELFKVLQLFDRWRDSTHGALDASAETITRVWQAAAARQRVPSRAELATAVAAVRQVHWRLDVTRRAATHTSDAPLAMNSFVKSYIVGRSASAALDVAGVRGAVVNIGGDLVVRGEWTEPVDIADPQSDAENSAPIARLLVHDRAVATSGDYRRGFSIAGRHYSHIVDPRTGMPADRIISSTVIAPEAADAGALATASSVLSPDETRRLAASMPGVEFLLVTGDGQQIMSDGWSAVALPAPRIGSGLAAASGESAARAVEVRPVAFVTQAGAPGANGGQGGSQSKAPSPPAAHANAGALPPKALPAVWNRQYELAISIELAHIEGVRIMRPFVGVWIEDSQRTPVRTLALWYGSYRYLPELKVWFRDEDLGLNETKDLNYINSVSSATRPPGMYTLKWDGRADNGKLVPLGKYTVLIEASREHGTYQVMRQEMDFTGKPGQFQFPGGMEIASASLDYHPIKH